MTGPSVFYAREAVEERELTAVPVRDRMAGSGKCTGPIGPNRSWGGSRSLPSKAHGRFSGGLVGDAPVLERGATRAADFAKGWQDATYGRGETQSFYNAFFRIFGVQRRSVTCYEAHVTKLDNHSGFIDLFCPGVLLVEQKSAGRDLGKAYQQTGEYFDALRDGCGPATAW